MSWKALMPLRGGSKSIPRKNLKKMGGKPLYFWALNAAIESRIFDEVCVSTEDDEMAKSVRQLFSNVRVIKRPPHLATDQASSESVLDHFLESNDCEIVSLIQATSPLTSGQDFVNGKKTFETVGADSLVTAVEWKRFFWNEDGKPVNYDPSQRPLRQNFEGWLMENGAFYFTKVSSFKSSGSRLSGKIAVHKMPPNTATEIDESEDWEIVESLLLRRRVVPRLSEVKYLVVDVDGTLTDGGMYYGEGGEMGKRFDTRDWHGLQSVEGTGIPVCIMTAEDSPAVHARLKKVPLSHYHFGVKNKLECLKELLKEWKAEVEEVAFIGDDQGDLECMEVAGFSACPADASEEAIRIGDYVCERKGGHGAVREVCDLIVKSREGTL